MIFLSFIFSYIGFISLSLSQKRHYKKMLGEQEAFSYSPVLNQFIGYACIAIACALCILTYKAPIGIAYWIGISAAAGLLQAMLLTFWPQKAS